MCRLQGKKRFSAPPAHIFFSRSEHQTAKVPQFEQKLPEISSILAQTGFQTGRSWANSATPESKMGILANNFELREIYMKIKFTTGLLALAFVLGSAVLAATATSHQAKERSSATVTVAGCLHNGTTTDVFVLTAKDGKGWDVTSKTVDISKHVGHTVSLTGTPVTTASTDGSAASATTRLDVSDLKMVSESCSQ
jgi:hypothetical protein